MVSSDMPVMERNPPSECPIPPEWVTEEPYRHGMRYRCPLAVKAMFKVRVGDGGLLGANGIADAIGVSPKTVYGWSYNQAMSRSNFLSFCRLWHEHIGP